MGAVDVGFGKEVFVDGLVVVLPLEEEIHEFLGLRAELNSHHLPTRCHPGEIRDEKKKKEGTDREEDGKEGGGGERERGEEQNRWKGSFHPTVLHLLSTKAKLRGELAHMGQNQPCPLSRHGGIDCAFWAGMKIFYKHFDARMRAHVAKMPVKQPVC
ncbi:hypothetical protein GW17_00032626 [Ensete ventricosum]|nr:hypothetical protein GW17_00032626 [Ensete ventricosum]